MKGWLRRVGRFLGRRRGRHARPWHDAFNETVLPRTPAAAAPCEQCGSRDRAELGGQVICGGCGAVPFAPWPPRITRWVRVTFPLPDDTMLLPSGTAAMVLDLMASDFAWDIPR